MKLSSVVPWGRSFSEYREMFSLSADDLYKKILGCSDGPASFNAQLTAMGGNIISADPIYEFDAEQIRLRIDKVYPEIMGQVSTHRDDYVWHNIPDVEALANTRMEAMNIFLNDYETGRENGRYITASLPKLPFDDDTFELALCSHYLFLYSEHVDAAQHTLAMNELCRVANEVRVYPLLSITDNRTSPHLDRVRDELEQNGIETSLVRTEYEFQKGATEMLVAKHCQSPLEDV